MATKRKAAKAKTARKASGEATIHHSVYQSGVMYNPGKDGGPGDEAKLAAAGFDDAVMQNMTDRGLISGFGFEKSAEAEAAEEQSEEE